MDIPEPLNADFIDSQYEKWKADSDSVSRDWQFFFEGFSRGAATGSASSDVCGDANTRTQARVEALKYRYRDLGHLLACMDPLEACPISHPLLDLNAFKLSEKDLDTPFVTRAFSRTMSAPLREIIDALRQTYCRSVGVEYMHLQDPDERRWLQEKMEPVRNQPEPTREDRLRILKKLQQAAVFEQFLNKKYVAVTRFSLEGGDALIPMLDVLADHSAAAGCREIILGMAHRGRLNVQTHILDKPYEDIFGEFESCYDPESLVGAGDVKYHNGYLADITTSGGRPLRIFLVNNPSHLEAVSPVVEGLSRARQDLAEGGDRSRVLPVLIHGDAAFAGQGVVFETLNMSQLSGYATGGTLHIVINNQIGYTTLPEDARSTRYATDVAKGLMVPIFHVHGENPEAAVHVIRLAAEYRNAFGKDAVIDLVCYRRYGHNEGDEPYFTQPTMYDRIRKRPSLHKIYTKQLAAAGIIDEKAAAADEAAAEKAIEEAYESIHGTSCTFPEAAYFENWDGYHGDYSHTPIDTGVDEGRLKQLSESLNTVPENFSMNRKLSALYKKRQAAVETGESIDWANAEALAFASLLAEGASIRLSGQDSGRGTFAQRHSVLVDTKTGQPYVPLSTVAAKGARFDVFNSLLAEYAVLGFDYGYSLARPECLVCWEAQFGDFVNNAQSVIDLFIASGQSKWQRLSGLTLLLPHGFEGLGPEHSSARPERFLQLCAEDNMQVVNATTPAQYFHLLRRQVLRKVRKPLVVLTPKSLLRHPLAVSDMADLTKGHFSEAIDDTLKTSSVKTLLFCSGKIYYELLQRRNDLKKKDTAIIRLEQFYPFPEEMLKDITARYQKAKTWIWVQEEPENMGPWWFMRPRLESLKGSAVQVVSRPPASSPATGFPKIYRIQQEAIAEAAVGKING